MRPIIAFFGNVSLISLILSGILLVIEHHRLGWLVLVAAVLVSVPAYRCNSK